MFDTHCHLNFKAYEGKVDEVIKRANNVDIGHILVPGTDIETSIKAVEIAGQHDGVYAAVGIHPHHVSTVKSEKLRVSNEKNSQFSELKKLLGNKKVLAIGEVGLDYFIYTKTKYGLCCVDEKTKGIQKGLFEAMIRLALEYDKSLILHNREAKDDFLKMIKDNWDEKLRGRTVFHCCEPDRELLDFAIEHNIFLGFDGDITYRIEKQEFVKKVPLELIVLETDSPYLVPEPLRSQKIFPNEPKNIVLIADFISRLTNTSINRLIRVAMENSKRLFRIT